MFKIGLQVFPGNHFDIVPLDSDLYNAAAHKLTVSQEVPVNEILAFLCGLCNVLDQY